MMNTMVGVMHSPAVTVLMWPHVTSFGVCLIVKRYARTSPGYLITTFVGYLDQPLDS
jgi:hypothetical protein